MTRKRFLLDQTFLLIERTGHVRDVNIARFSYLRHLDLPTRQQVSTVETKQFFHYGSQQFFTSARRLPELADLFMKFAPRYDPSSSTAENLDED